MEQIACCLHAENCFFPQLYDELKAPEKLAEEQMREWLARIAAAVEGNKQATRPEGLC